MLDRDDLTFATCYQLAGEIKEDWEDRPKVVDDALWVLRDVNDPEERFDHNEKLRLVAVYQILIAAMKSILKESDAWCSSAADMLKKELVLRIKQYESRITSLTTPSFAPCYVNV